MKLPVLLIFFLKLSSNKNIELVPQYYVIEQLRAIKEEEEIEKIKVAVKIAEESFFKD